MSTPSSPTYRRAHDLPQLMRVLVLHCSLSSCQSSSVCSTRTSMSAVSSIVGVNIRTRTGT
eukprot:scaffold215425_cov16-Prasinocladus_malaysianus.AAC.1